MNLVKQHTALAPLTQQLSARWTHPEREGVALDKLGHGDISSWSHGTTKAVRPEVGRTRATFSPIGSIKAVAGFYQARDRLVAIHDAKSIVAPSSSGKREVEKAIKDCEEEIKVLDARVNSNDFINKKLYQLTKKGGTVKIYE